MRASLALAFLSLLPAAPLAAQQVPAGLQQQQIADLERERRMTLAMVDSMPERLLHFKPVPEVRDFAQQIAHAAVPVAGFTFRARGGEPPAVGDSTVYLNSKTALRETVVKAYDYALQALRSFTPEEYVGTVKFVRQDMPRWRVVALAHEHSVWTRGELVGYFRLNGMAPPAFDLFDTGGGER
jgi:DinB superfamily